MAAIFDYGKLTAEQVVGLPQASLDVLALTFGKEASDILSEAQFEIAKVKLTAQIETIEALTPEILTALESIIPTADQVDWSEIGFVVNISVDEAGEISVKPEAFLRRDHKARTTTTKATGNDTAKLSGTNLTAAQVAEIGAKAGYTLGWVKTPRITASALLTKAGQPVKRGSSDEEVAAAFCRVFGIQGE